MSAETASGASRGSYPLLPTNELDVLAAELLPRSMAGPAERGLMRSMPGEQSRHFAEVPWVAPAPRFGVAEPVPEWRRLARQAGDDLSGLASGVSDSLAEWKRQQDIAEYQALSGWQQPLVAATDMGDIFVDGVTLGFGNKAAAALGTLTSDDSYDELLAKNRAITQGAYNRAGLAGTALGLAGGVRSGKSLVDEGLGFSRWAPKPVQGAPSPDLLKRLGDFGKTSALAAADGAVVGALDAIGHDTNVGTGVATGAGIGVVMPGAFKAVGAVFSPLVKQLSSSPVVQRMVDLPARGRAIHELETRAGRPEIYDPPGSPQRPFEADYPVAPKYDPATGRLLEDIEGRPLTARLVVGRRTKDGPDVALSRAEIREVGYGAGVKQYALVDPNDVHLQGHPSVIMYDRDPVTKKLTYVKIKTDRTQDIDDIFLLRDHETGHAVDLVVLDIPIDGVEDELRLVYSTLATGNWSPKATIGPEDFGYSPNQVREELMAEGIRAYMRDPNWFKDVAPNAAMRIRERVNVNTDINGVVQFNSVIGTGAGAGIGAGALLGHEEGQVPRPWRNKL